MSDVSEVKLTMDADGIVHLHANTPQPPVVLWMLEQGKRIILSKEIKLEAPSIVQSVGGPTLMPKGR